MTYATFERAALRVDVLRQDGIWPGIRTHQDGSYSLTYDPGETE